MRKIIFVILLLSLLAGCSESNKTVMLLADDLIEEVNIEDVATSR